MKKRRPEKKVTLFTPLADDEEVSLGEKLESKILLGLLLAVYEPVYHSRVCEVSSFREPKTPEYLPAILDDSSPVRFSGLGECVEYLVNRFGRKKEVENYFRTHAFPL